MYICYGSEVVEVDAISDESVNYIMIDDEYIYIHVDCINVQFIYTSGDYDYDSGEIDNRVLDWLFNYLNSLSPITPECLPAIFKRVEQLSDFTSMCNELIHEYMNTNTTKDATALTTKSD